MNHRTEISENRYRDYAESGPIDNPEIWAKYQSLRKAVSHLTQAEQIAIPEAATELANAQEKAAFLAVLRD